MKSLIFMVLLTTFFTGCSDLDNSKNSLDDSNHLQISRALKVGVEVSIFQQLSLEFSSELDVSTVTDSSVYMLDDLEEVLGVVPKVTIGKNTTNITFIPFQYLKKGKDYQLVVTTAVKNIKGQSLSENYYYSFKTKADEKVDATPITLIATKPQDDSMASTRTNISIQFSKNISPDAEFTGEKLIDLKCGDSNSSIDGKLTFLNSVVSFRPKTTLPKDVECRFELVGKISDMFGGVYSSSESHSWVFKTLAKELPINDGFKSFAKLDTQKNTYIIQAISQSQTISTLAVATNVGIEIYEVGIDANQAAPVLNKRYTYDISSKINSINSYMTNEKLRILISTQDGIHLLEIKDNSLQLIQKYLEGSNIHKSVPTFEDDNIANGVLSVSPQLGLQMFDINSTDGTLIVKTLVYNGVVGRALDVVTLTKDDEKRIFVADYNGGVVILDENGSKISTTTIAGSVKKLSIRKSNSIIQSLYAICSSGKVDVVNFDGTLNSTASISLLDTPKDVSSYNDSNSTNLYYSTGEDGILVSLNDILIGTISTQKEIVSSTIVSILNIKFLVTLSSDGNIEILNAVPNIYPTVIDIPGTLEIPEIPDNNTTVISTIVPSIQDLNISISEDVEFGRRIGTLSIDAGDSNITVITLNDSTNFKISLEGNITTKTTFDFETLPNDYNLTVTATNQAGDSNVANISIAITNIIDTVAILDHLRIEFEEGFIDSNTIIGSIPILNQGDSDITSMVLSGSDIGDINLTINKSGEIAIDNYGFYFDYEIKSNYELNVTAINAAGTSNPSNVSINITDRIYPAIAKLDSNNSTMEQFGGSVASNGRFTIVGSSSTDSVSIYANVNGIITFIQEINSTKSNNTSFGNQVAINSFNDFIVGSNGENKAYLYSIDVDTVGVHINKLKDFNGSDTVSGDMFGWSVDISDSHIIVGATGDDNGSNANAGSAYVFELNATEITKLTASDATASASFGGAVATDGNYFVVGASGKDGGKGGAYIFEKTLNGFTEQIISQGIPSAYFGSAVAIDDLNVLIGGSGGKGVYLYNITDGIDSNITSNYFSQIDSSGTFGNSVAISTDKLIVGSLIDNNTTGSAYIFTHNFDNNGTFNVDFVEKVIAVDAQQNHYFGSSVDIVEKSSTETQLLIGAFRDSTDKVNKGSVYILESDPN